MTGKNKLGKAEQDFVDRMGIVAEGDGLARITGRIWGLLIVTGDPLTSAEIADLLVIVHYYYVGYHSMFGFLSYAFAANSLMLC